MHYELKGIMGKLVTVDDQGVHIKGKALFRSYEKTVPFDQITSVVYSKISSKQCTMLFQTTGCIERRESDENLVIFDISQSELAQQIKVAVEQEMTRSKNNHVMVSANSDADELQKFKQLLDSGVITQDEFDSKKKQLLGL